MKRLYIILLTALIAFPAQAAETVTIMADSSLSVAMTMAARDYSRRHGAVVNVSFAPHTQQQAQIQEGSAADVVITPKTAWIESLKMQGLVDIYSQTPVAKNRLALVGPANSPLASRTPLAKQITQMIALFGWEPSFVVGSPDMLDEGVYGKEALRNLALDTDLEEYTLYVKRRDQMFDMVANQSMYGLFFYSSTIGRSGLRVIDLLPENTHRPIEYYALAIAGDNMGEARKFLHYLTSAQAKNIFRDSGL